MKADVGAETWAVSRTYAWVVFALTFGLLLSDYMSRQVLVAVFPQLKADWRLNDAQLGGLVSIVALAVGVLTFPLSVLADRMGRVRSVAVMALFWSLSTASCGIAAHYDQMLVARLCIGVGEAAYGSVGAAVLFSVFPKHLRGTVQGAFMAGGVFGSVVGLGLGGAVASHFGWRAAFLCMAVFGAVLGGAYLVIVSEARIRPRHTLNDGPAARLGPRFVSGETVKTLIADLFSQPTARLTYLGSGVQMFLTASMLAWVPSHLNRDYGLKPDKAAVLGAGFLLISACGMIACGMIADYFSRRRAVRRATFCAVFSLVSAVLLGLAFLSPPGSLQLALIGAGLVTAGGFNGPAGALAADVTPLRAHASVMAVLTLSNNLIGLAPGPMVTGLLADRLGLAAALRFVPAVGIVAALIFWAAARSYARYLGDENP